MDTLDQIDQRAALLKRGARLLAKTCGGNDAAGQIVGRSGEQVRRWGEVAFPETMPIFAVVLLEAECGQPILTRMMAEMARHGLVPQEGLPAGACIDSAMLDAMQAKAELLLYVNEARRDGVITPNESARIAELGLKSQEKTAAVIRAGQSGPPGNVVAIKAGA